MAALGVDRRQLVTLGMARNLVVALPVRPVPWWSPSPCPRSHRSARRAIAETSTGVAFDALVLPLGALAMVVVVLALGIWPAVRAARSLRPDDRRRCPRPSAVVAHLAAIGAPPSAVIGVRNALQRRTGGATVSRWEAPCSERCSR